MLSLIINTDDLGYGASPNRATFAWMERGTFSSATLIANAPAPDDAVARMTGFPALPSGEHVTFGEFAPSRAHSEMTPLLDEQGRFARRLRATRPRCYPCCPRCLGATEAAIASAV